MKKYLVFSDLDGTLLNHDDYSFDPASEALRLLASRSIPLIISTSKTFEEVVKIQQRMGIREPFIVENGAGIFIPRESALVSKLASQEDWIKVSQSHSYSELRKIFTKMKKNTLFSALET